jgi:hypothetical protein
VGTAIVVTLLVLLAVGIVTDQLLQLKKWLKGHLAHAPDAAVGLPPGGELGESEETPVLAALRVESSGQTRLFDRQ